MLRQATRTSFPFASVVSKAPSAAVAGSFAHPVDQMIDSIPPGSSFKTACPLQTSEQLSSLEPTQIPFAPPHSPTSTGETCF